MKNKAFLNQSRHQHQQFLVTITEPVLLYIKVIKIVCIVVTADATHRPVEFFHLHAGFGDYFHHGGQRFQKFDLQPTKWIKLSVNL